MTTELEQAERDLADQQAFRAAHSAIIEAADKNIAALEARIESLRKAEPLRLWVNVGGDMLAAGYPSEADAKYRARNRTRIAVPMAEVPEGWQCRGPYTRQEISNAAAEWNKGAYATAEDARIAANAALGFGGGK